MAKNPENGERTVPRKASDNPTDPASGGEILPGRVIQSAPATQPEDPATVTNDTERTARSATQRSETQNQASATVSTQESSPVPSPSLTGRAKKSEATTTPEPDSTIDRVLFVRDHNLMALEDAINRHLERLDEVSSHVRVYVSTYASDFLATLVISAPGSAKRKLTYLLKGEHDERQDANAGVPEEP